jgi:hypothetical protein
MFGVVHPRRRRVGRTSPVGAQAYHTADPTPTAKSELRSGFPARGIGNLGLTRLTDRIAALAEVILRVQRSRCRPVEPDGTGRLP